MNARPHALHQEVEALAAAEDRLPEPLPPGERLLWQGQPDWRLLAVHVLHLRLILAASLLFAALSTVVALAHGAGAPFLALAVAAPLLGGAVAVGLASLSAWLLARVSRYTVTDRRLVMRVGLIVPITLNIPFSEITDVAIRPLGAGAGDLPIQVRSHPRIYYMLLWPHVRPLRFRRVEPMLRGLRDGEAAGEVLVSALRQAHAATALELRRASAPAPAPALMAAE